MRHLFSRETHNSDRSGSAGAVTVRSAYPDDEGAIARLAALDSSHPPVGPMLLAEDGDQLLAVLSLADGTVLADPFHPTAELIRLLHARAAALAD